jgi:hypothetical protein
MLCWLYPKTFWGLSSGRVSIRYNWVYHVDILVTLSTFWLSVKWSADIEALHRYSFTNGKAIRNRVTRLGESTPRYWVIFFYFLAGFW